MQDLTAEILKSKYLIAEMGEETIFDNYKRIASTLAKVEVATNPECSNVEMSSISGSITVGTEEYIKWQGIFYQTFVDGGIGGGRIMSNAGATDKRGQVSLINCIGLPDIEDSMDSIFKVLHENAMLLKYGCGTGGCWSYLRPNGASVAGAGASTSGPLSFADVYDAACKTVSSAGGRRGAQMLTFLVSHPDIFDVINAKRKDGRLRTFNISILITDKFMTAVRLDQDWELVFNGKVYRTVKAREIWDAIMDSNYDFAEPGIIFIDRINEMNNLWFIEYLDRTNPCGEQPLPSRGSCLLAAIDASRMVIDPFTRNARIDYDKLSQVTRDLTRMADNVVEIANLPIEGYAEELRRKRRHGLGITGLGTALVMLGVKYGSLKAREIISKIMEEIALTSYDEGANLAELKGEAPILKERFIVTEDMVRLRPNKISVGDDLSGRQLWLMSKYFDIFESSVRGQKVLDKLANLGCRFTHAITIAPTGTISIAFCDNTSNGVESSYEHMYYRNLTVEGKISRESRPVFSKEYIEWKKILESRGSDAGNLDGLIATMHNDELGCIPEAMIGTNDVSIEGHVMMQASAQKWVDSSISKTINVPTDITREDFKNVYMLAWENGLKGCTTFRFNPNFSQGILIREEDLKGMKYTFTLNDGTSVELLGNDKIHYMGEEHTVANLYEAIKEGKI
jgi:ribonucleoside-diphosphate reductase alpha chain